MPMLKLTIILLLAALFIAMSCDPVPPETLPNPHTTEVSQ